MELTSSYAKNNYGDIITAIVTGWRPYVCVELGVLYGYSTLAIGAGLRENNRVVDIPGMLDAYDLFDEYEFKHGNMAAVSSKIVSVGLNSFITLHKQNAWEVHRRYAPGSVSFLHVDISNTGETLKSIMELWDPLMQQGGVILFEGGSAERDQVEWMVKYNKRPIMPELDSNKIIEANYVYATYLQYPSLTMLLKKR